MITVSACMIVKNEEGRLAACLDGVAEIADEIIIVDTGSADRTVEIAGRYTDKIYSFPWIDDFAAARNYSLSMASMEYVYTADADEVLDAHNIKKFRKLKEVLLPEIDVVQMYYTNQLAFNTTYNFDRELRPKLYKRLRELKFEGQIHEMAVLDAKVYDSDIEICHKPHESHAGRDLSIFRKIIREQGGLSKRLSAMYARELFIGGGRDDFVQAGTYFRLQMEDAALTEDEIKRCQCVLARCAAIEGDTEAFFKISMKNIAMGKASSEVCYELGEHYFHKRDYEEAAIWYYNAAYETEPDLDIRCQAGLPLARLAQCHRFLGNDGAAVHYEECIRNLDKVTGDRHDWFDTNNL